jgi:hypothetical protein
MSDLLRTRAADTALAWDGPNPCPPLTAAEDDALRKSLTEDGFIPAFPIVMSAGPACEGQIIDGFNRMRVCEELGIEPIVLMHPCATELEFKILQIKANLERRQLSTSQRALLAVRLLPLYEARAKLRQAAAGLANLGQSAQSSPDTGVGTERGESAHLAAEAAGISGTLLKQMKKITEAENAEQLLEQISSGKSVKRAYESLRDVDTSLKNEKQAERELAEHYPAASTRDALVAERERAVGDAVRLAMDLDALIRKHALIAEDVKQLRSRPHTFTGAARRLNEWLGEIEEVL